MKKMIFAVLSAMFLFAACKKNDAAYDQTPAPFTVNGVRDVDMNRDAGLNLSIVQAPESAGDRVTLNVSGLPSGVTAIVSTLSGCSHISFAADGNAAGGTYAVRIVATSASYRSLMI